MDGHSTIEYAFAAQNPVFNEMRSALVEKPDYAFCWPAATSAERAEPSAGDADRFSHRSSQTYIEAVARSVPSTSSVFIKAISPLTIPASDGPTAMHSVIELVRPFLTLQAGWDGYDGVAPSPKAVDDAERFAMSHLFAFEQRLPSISPGADGEVNFCWRDKDCLLDLGFYGDGTYSYYAKLGDGREFMADMSAVDARLPEEIAAAICRA